MLTQRIQKRLSLISAASLQQLARTHQNSGTKSDSSLCTPIGAQRLHSPYVLQDVLQTLDT